MEGIRAGWNKALRTIYYCCWNETQPRNRIMLLAGPWWWNCHFLGEESGPLLRQSGQHRFPSCSYDAIQKQHTTIIRIQSSISSCHHWKTNWAVGIRTEIIYCCRSGIEGVGWKVRIAWLADWLEGKDSMIDWLRVLWIMGHSYLGRDRWTSFGQAEAIWA